SMAHRRCPVGRSRPRPTSATTCRPRSESIISVSNYRELLLVASDLAATVSLKGRRRWFDDQGVDSGVREPGVDGAPAATSVDALEHAAPSGSCIDGGGRRGVDRQREDHGVREAGVDGAPAATPVAALEHAASKGPSIEGGGRLGVDRDGLDNGVGKPAVDSAPAATAVRALEYAASESS